MFLNEHKSPRHIQTLESLVLDQLLLTINDKVESFVVSNGNISSLEPAVLRNRLRSRFWVIQVSLIYQAAKSPHSIKRDDRKSKAHLHDRRSSNPNLTRFTMWHVFLVVSNKPSFQVCKKKADRSLFAVSVCNGEKDASR